MVYAKSRLDVKKALSNRPGHGFVLDTVSGDRSDRRDRRCPPCRRKGGQQHRQNAHNNAAEDTDDAHLKERNLHELRTSAKPKECTKKPSD